MNLIERKQEGGGGNRGLWDKRREVGGCRRDLVEEEKWGTEMLQDQVGKDEGYVWNSLE